MDILNDINLNSNKIFIDNSNTISLAEPQNHSASLRIGGQIDEKYNIDPALYINGTELLIRNNNLNIEETRSGINSTLILNGCGIEIESSGIHKRFALLDDVNNRIISLHTAIKTEFLTLNPQEEYTQYEQKLTGENIIFQHAPTFNEGFKLGTDDITFNAEETITFATKEEYHNADVAQFSNRITIENPIDLNIENLNTGTEIFDFDDNVLIRKDLQQYHVNVITNMFSEIIDGRLSSIINSMSEVFCNVLQYCTSGNDRLSEFNRIIFYDLYKDSNHFTNDIGFLALSEYETYEAEARGCTGEDIKIQQLDYRVDNCIGDNSPLGKNNNLLLSIYPFAVYNTALNPQGLGTGIYTNESYCKSGLIAIQENQLFEKVFTNPELTPDASGVANWTEYVYKYAVTFDNEIGDYFTEYAYKFTPQMQLAEITTDENGNKISVIKETFKQFNMSSSQALVSFETNETIPAGKYELSIIGR